MLREIASGITTVGIRRREVMLPLEDLGSSGRERVEDVSCRLSPGRFGGRGVELA